MVRSIQSQPERIWTSVEKHNLYNEKGGREKKRSGCSNKWNIQEKEDVGSDNNDEDEDEPEDEEEEEDEEE